MRLFDIVSSNNVRSVAIVSGGKAGSVRIHGKGDFFTLMLGRLVAQSLSIGGRFRPEWWEGA